MGPVRIAATPTSRARRAAAALIPLTAAGLVLSGCSADGLSGSVAAVVDGKEISVEQVQEATAEFNALGVQQPTTTSDTLTLLIYGDLASEIYSQSGGAPIADERIVEVLQSGGAENPSDSLVEMYRSVSHIQGLGGLPPTDDLDISINPRYGQWDPAAGQVVTADPDWITEVTTGGQP